jgi:ATP-binding cassette, subfamily D (ALD), peroxisomal long-chain fatty acid import protein
MTEDFIIKYMWSAMGYIVISLPVFLTQGTEGLVALSAGEEGSKVVKRTEDYISNRRLLLTLGDAGGRLM